MTDALVIARREIEEKKFVFLAAAAFALLAVVLPFVPGIRAPHPVSLIRLTSACLAIAFSLAVAAILGGSIVGRDLTAGRMSFYFARPVSSTSIWFGKLFASIVMVALTFAIVVAPGVATGMRSLSDAFGSEGVSIAIIGGSAAVLFFFIHAGGTMVRSRSPLIALDFLAATATVFFGWLIVRPLLMGAAVLALKILAWSAGAFLLVAFVAAGAWQLADGRTDRRRSHTAFSKVFWGVIAVLVLLAGGFTAWLVSVTPSDLAMAYGSTSGSGALITGVAPHRFDYRPLFLYDVITGESQRLGGVARWEGVLSRDGSHFVGIDVDPRGDRGEVFVRDARPGSEMIATSIMFRRFDALAASDDGARIATVHDGVLSVYDVTRRQSLGSARVGDARVGWMFFPSPNEVRLYFASHTSTMTSIGEADYDVASHVLRRGGTIEVEAKFVHPTAKPDGSEVIWYASPRVNAPQLVDGRTLRPIAVLPRHGGATFLRDGRIAMAAADGATHRVSLLLADANGTVTNTIDLGKGTWAIAMAEVAAGTVVVDVGEPGSWHACTVDIASGRVRTEENLRGTGGFFSFAGDPRQPNIGATSLMIDVKRGVAVRWNALTGERKPL